MDDNSELIEILGVLSHDLGASMRQVCGLAGAIEDSEFEALTEEGRRCFSLLATSAERGALIIERLRGYRRVLELDVSVQECVAGRLARALGRVSEVELSWRGLDELDGASVDARALEVVLRELVRNAELFGASHVEVSIQRRDELLQLDIKDDGIGIEARHHESIFRFGRRLHPPHVYPGAGFGLAMVRVACRDRGWRVRVSESSPGRGSVFTLELPLCRDATVV